MHRIARSLGCHASCWLPHWLPSAGRALAQDDTSLLDTVISRGRLICGVNGQCPVSLSRPGTGEMVGFDADFCRAASSAK